MFIDCSKLPDPASPCKDDVYISPDGRHTLVVLLVPGSSLEPGNAEAVKYERSKVVISFVVDGMIAACPHSHFAAIVVSLAARPWGRLDRTMSARPAISRDPELVKDRLAAFGPHLRALREQYGLSIGDLAQALGCAGARLSKLELADPDPVVAGVREDEGRAALTELITETVADTHIGLYSGVAESFKAAVWGNVHTVLATAPARAAMATIMKASAEAGVKGTALWEKPADVRDREHLADILVEHISAMQDANHPGDPDDQPVSASDLAELRGVMLSMLLTPRAIAAMQRFLGDTRLDLFRPGDAITYEDKAAVVMEVDNELGSMMVRFASGNTSIVKITESKLANEDVATETARAGLAHLLGERLFNAHPARDWAAEDFAGEITVALDTDEARRLIRLHG